MIAVQNWFLRKQGFDSLRIKQIKDGVITIKKETEKAVLLEIGYMDYFFEKIELWCPKSCLLDKWETKVTPLDYHDYLVRTAVKAYEDGTIPQNVIKHTRTRKGTIYVDYTYHESQFYHTWKTSELKSLLGRNQVKYMSFEEYKKGQEK